MSENIETTEVTVIETGIKTEQLSEFNLSENKVTGLKKMFDPMLAKLQEFEDDYNEIVNSYDPESTDIDKDLVKRAKRLRIDISKVRTLTDTKGKEERAEANRYAKAVIGAVNIVEFVSKSKEKVLKEIETHAEKIEAERLKALQIFRSKIAVEHGFTEEMDFSGMAQTVFDNFIEGAKAKKIAEEEATRKQDLRISRQTECLNLSEYIPCYDAIDLGELDYSTFEDMKNNAIQKKANKEKELKLKKEAEEKEQQRIKDENAKLLKEKEESEARAKAEKLKQSERAKELQQYIVFIRDYDSLISACDEEYKKEFEEIVKGADAHWEFERKEAVRIQEEKEATEAREADEKKRQDNANQLAKEAREKAETEAHEAKEAEALKALEAEEAKEAEEIAKVKLKEAQDAEAKRIESIKALAESSKEITIEEINRAKEEGKTVFVQVVSVETIEGKSGIFIKPADK